MLSKTYLKFNKLKQSNYKNFRNFYVKFKYFYTYFKFNTIIKIYKLKKKLNFTYKLKLIKAKFTFIKNLKKRLKNIKVNTK